jgi:hypothetical protein
MGDREGCACSPNLASLPTHATYKAAIDADNHDLASLNEVRRALRRHWPVVSVEIGHVAQQRCACQSWSGQSQATRSRCTWRSSDASV